MGAEAEAGSSTTEPAASTRPAATRGPSHLATSAGRCPSTYI